MPKFLQGNYNLPTSGDEEPSTEESQKPLAESFEDSVLAKLGGSICFVTKGKTFLWTGDDSEAPRP